MRVFYTGIDDESILGALQLNDLLNKGIVNVERYDYTVKLLEIINEKVVVAEIIHADGTIGSRVIVYTEKDMNEYMEFVEKIKYDHINCLIDAGYITVKKK